MNELTYKPGEGYWTRMLTAVGGGLLVLWLAAWLWNQMSTVNIPLDEATGEPIFQPIFLQGGVAGLVVLLGAAAIFWFVYHKRTSSEFLIATDGEMKKVNWSTRREILGSTWVVIGVSVTLALGILLTDIFFKMFFDVVFGL